MKLNHFILLLKKLKKRKDIEYLGFTYNVDSEENRDKLYKNVIQTVDNIKNGEEEKDNKEKENNGNQENEKQEKENKENES